MARVFFLKSCVLADDYYCKVAFLAAITMSCTSLGLVSGGCWNWCQSNHEQIPKWFLLNGMTIQPGDLFESVTPKALWLAISVSHLASVKVSSRWRPFTRLVVIDANRDDSLAVKRIPVNSLPDGWDSKKAIALVSRLRDKLLPYSFWCNETRYMRYIVFGEVLNGSVSWIDQRCPLMRDLKPLSVEDILKDNFYLETGRKRDAIRIVNVKNDLRSIQTSAADEEL